MREQRTETRVLLLGESGMLGSQLARMLSPRFHLLCPAAKRGGSDSRHEGVSRLSSRPDARHEAGWEELITQARPDVVVNCIAAIPGSGQTPDPLDFIPVNSLFPHRLAALARASGARVIHIGTDGVFSGRQGSYREEDLPDPPDLYGRSKLLGEIEESHCLTLRTSFYGPNPNRKGLFEWLLQQEGRRIKGFSGYIFSGLSVLTLARLIGDLIEREPFLHGIYHAGGLGVSKFHLLEQLARAMNLNVEVEPDSSQQVNRTLDSTRFWSAMNMEPPSLEEQVEEVASASGSS